jgi:hypothetical protein
MLPIATFCLRRDSDKEPHLNFKYSNRARRLGRKLRIASFVAERKRIPKMPQPYTYDLRQKVIQAIKLDGLTGLKQKLSPNQAQTGFISRKYVHIFLQPAHKSIRYNCSKS